MKLTWNTHIKGDGNENGTSVKGKWHDTEIYIQMCVTGSLNEWEIKSKFTIAKNNV